MDKTFEKISAYEIFNNFFPGVLMCGYLMWLFEIEWPDISLAQGTFVVCIVYLCGIVISRIGSLVVQPLAKETHFIDWSDGFYQAERLDSKLSILLKDLNMYNSLFTTALIAVMVAICASFSGVQLVLPGWLLVLCGFLLSFVLAMAYRKQSKYITRRINVIKEEQ